MKNYFYSTVLLLLFIGTVRAQTSTDDLQEFKPRNLYFGYCPAMCVAEWSDDSYLLRRLSLSLKLGTGSIEFDARDERLIYTDSLSNVERMRSEVSAADNTLVYPHVANCAEAKKVRMYFRVTDQNIGNLPRY